MGGSTPPKKPMGYEFSGGVPPPIQTGHQMNPLVFPQTQYDPKTCQPELAREESVRDNFQGGEVGDSDL